MKYKNILWMIALFIIVAVSVTASTNTVIPPTGFVINTADAEGLFKPQTNVTSVNNNYITIINNITNNITTYQTNNVTTIVMNNITVNVTNNISNNFYAGWLTVTNDIYFMTNISIVSISKYLDVYSNMQYFNITLNETELNNTILRVCSAFNDTTYVDYRLQYYYNTTNTNNIFYNKSYIDSTLNNYLQKSGDTMSGALNYSFNGTVTTYNNGCIQIANATGLYFIC